MSLILRNYTSFYIKWFQKQMWDLLPSSPDEVVEAVEVSLWDFVGFFWQLLSCCF